MCKINTKMKIGNRILSTEKKAFVMGIVNATPDSFFEGSRGGIERAMQLIEQGADIIDIGGESTRPGFTPVSVQEEIKRVVPLVKEIRKHSDIPISIDTTKLEVMKACMDYDVQIWNDVLALSGKKENACFVAKNNISVILMHNGEGDIEQVNKELCATIDFVLQNGIKKEQIIVDPGIGFGKTNEQSINIIKNTDKICNLEYPVLMALSRKRCIGEMTGRPAEQRLVGTVTANLISVQRGACMIRVHDVKETVDMLNVLKSLSR